MNKHIRRFILAVSFMTIIPITRNHDFKEDDLAFSTVYFPLVGLLLGLLSWGIFLTIYPYLPLSVTVFIILAFLTLITGALHEDGLGDTFDGFGGGYTKERILEIMKDSRIGTYGSLALIFLIFGKYIFLTEIDPTVIPKTIVTALVCKEPSVGLHAQYRVHLDSKCRDREAVNDVFRGDDQFDRLSLGNDQFVLRHFLVRIEEDP